MSTAERLVRHLLEDGFDPEEVEATAASFQPRLKWWIVPALFVVKATERLEAEDIAAGMQDKANSHAQIRDYGGMLFLDEELPTVEIKEGEGEDFEQERPHTVAGYIPGLVYSATHRGFHPGGPR